MPTAFELLTTCPLCERMGDLGPRGLCADCLRAFDEGYSAGWTSRDDEDDVPVGCKHGNNADLCEACKAEEAKEETRRARTRQEILDKMHASLSPGCRACGDEYATLSSYRLCPRCTAKYLEYLAELVAANPPPVAAPEPTLSVAERGVLGNAPEDEPEPRGWMSRLAELFRGGNHEP